MSRIAAAALITAAPFTLAACSPAATVDTAKVAKEVNASADAIVAAYNAKDAAKAASYDAPDYVGLFHGSDPVRGAEADERTMAQQLQDPAVGWTVHEPRVAVSEGGDTAIYEAQYEFAYTDPITERPTRERGNWVAIFTRQADGSMKLWRSIAVDLPRPPAPAPAAN